MSLPRTKVRVRSFLRLQAKPRLPIPLRRLGPNDTLFHEGSRAQAIYVIRGGTFKIVHTAEDGYEQVLGFAGRTEVLG